MKIMTLLSKVVSLTADGGTNGVNRECSQASAEIVRVEGAECRRNAFLEAWPRNLRRRSCVSKARNAGKIASSDASPSAEIVRVEGEIAFSS